jgi:hypothetical protein
MVRGSYSIDSLKLRIPLCYVTVDDRLKDNWIPAHLNDRTGEIEFEENFKKRALYVTEHGVKTKYVRALIKHAGTHIEQLVIQFNSKLLGSDYFEGINAKNINRIYLALMNQGIVYIQWERFFEGLCTDVDFKADYTGITFEGMRKAVKGFEIITESSSKKGEGCRPFDDKKNIGIEWSEREASYTKPFVKFYCKNMEFEHNSKEFFEHYFGSEKFEPKWRFEFNLKDKNHLTRGYSEEIRDTFPDLNTTLGNLLSLSQETVHLMGIDSLKRHLKGRYKMPVIKENSETIPPLDVFIANSVRICKEYLRFENLKEGVASKEADAQLLDVVRELTSGMDRVNKSKWKNKITANFTAEMPEEKANLEYEVLDFFEDLGLV